MLELAGHHTIDYGLLLCYYCCFVRPKGGWRSGCKINMSVEGIQRRHVNRIKGGAIAVDAEVFLLVRLHLQTHTICRPPPDR